MLPPSTLYFSTRFWDRGRAKKQDGLCYLETSSHSIVTKSTSPVMFLSYQHLSNKQKILAVSS